MEAVEAGVCVVVGVVDIEGLALSIGVVDEADTVEVAEEVEVSGDIVDSAKGGRVEGIIGVAVPIVLDPPPRKMVAFWDNTTVKKLPNTKK